MALIHREGDTAIAYTSGWATLFRVVQVPEKTDPHTGARTPATEIRVPLFMRQRDRNKYDTKACSRAGKR